MNVNFKFVEHGSIDWEKAVQLREEVLRKPLGSVFTVDELEEEKDHFHVAGFIAKELVATAVLVPEMQIMKMQRVAVAENHRNTTIGSLMMVFCANFAQAKNVEILYCHARNTAVNFYLKNGYEQIGDYFDEDGIPHLKMQKVL